MPFTRHLYEIDEVVSALQICLRNGWGRAVFWTWELRCSRLTDLLIDTLRESWLRWGAPRDPTLVAIFPTLDTKTDSDTWISVTVRVLTACREASQHQVTVDALLKQTANKPDRPNMTPTAKTKKIQERRQTRSATFISSLSEHEEITQEDAKHWWISYDAACRQGYRRDAVWLLQVAQHVMSADAIWSGIRTASRGGEETATILQQFRAMVSAHPVQQMLGQTAATLFLCESTETRKAMMNPTPQAMWAYIRDWDNWCDNIGRRAARIHAIPTNALHRATTRGSLSQRFTNIDEIREPLPSLLDGCPWWKRQIEKAGIVVEDETGAVVFQSDESIEDFYDQHFPDDTPDEWSRADQEKSHGRGCFETANEPELVVIREDPVSQQCWNFGIHVPGRKHIPVVTKTKMLFRR